MNLKDVKGKLAVVTGGSSGIGYAIAEALAVKGFDLLLVARSKEQLLEASSQINDKYDVVVQTVSVDVSKEDEVANLRNVVRGIATCADLVVNSAGIVSVGYLEDVPLEEWDRLFSVNVRGLVSVLQSLVPDMIRQNSLDGERRHIVNIASAAAYSGVSGMSAYSATKAGVLALSESLAHELSSSEIGVTTVCPETVKTPISGKTMLFGRLDNEQSRRKIDKMFVKSTITAEELAQKTLSAISQNKLVVPAGKQALAAYHFKRLMPSTFFGFIGKSFSEKS